MAERIQVQEISIDLLTEHPENSNYMNAVTAQKLRRHIEQTGRYEPLTVRPHPSEHGKFQVINGHNRLRVLRSLNFTEVNCIVWNLNDQQARLYLATLNRLSGKELPERRAALLDNLFKSLEVDELSLLLPEDQKQIEQLKRLANFEIEELAAPTSKGKDIKAVVMVSFTLNEPEVQELNLALDLVIDKVKGNLSRSQALISVVRAYLQYVEFRTVKLAGHQDSNRTFSGLTCFQD